MNESYIHALIGGMIIGLAAVLLYWFNGRIMGVGGIVSRLLSKPGRDSIWRFAFVGGLILGGFIFERIFSVCVVINASTKVIFIAGFLVGFGVVIGSGCTSGHGICGIARLSKRSIIATIVFMVTGMLTVFLKRILGI